MGYVNLTCQFGRTRSKNFYFYCEFLKNDTFDNVHHFTMVYITLKPLLYSFVVGTEVPFKMTSAGNIHYLDRRVINFFKMT